MFACVCVQPQGYFHQFLGVNLGHDIQEPLMSHWAERAQEAQAYYSLSEVFLNTGERSLNCFLCRKQVSWWSVYNGGFCCISAQILLPVFADDWVK